jgi:hypothetical protein
MAAAPIFVFSSALGALLLEFTAFASVRGVGVVGVPGLRVR